MAFFGKVNYGLGQVPTSTTVSSTSTQIVAAAPLRKWCIVTNIGKKDIFAAVGQTALLNKGILIGRDGGSMLMDASVMSTQELNGITEEGTTTIAIQEGF